MRALMTAGLAGAGDSMGGEQIPKLTGSGIGTPDLAPSANTNAADDPFAMMLANMMQGQTGANGSIPQMPSMPSMPGMDVTPSKPPTLLQRLLPLLHVLSVWILLGYFVFYKEPMAFQAKTHGAGESGWLGRWGELLHGAGSVSSVVRSVFSVTPTALLNHLRYAVVLRGIYHFGDCTILHPHSDRNLQSIPSLHAPDGTSSSASTNSRVNHEWTEVHAHGWDPDG
jgi:hypothetical protein